jgi:hypothetical protein
MKTTNRRRCYNSRFYARGASIKLAVLKTPSSRMKEQLVPILIKKRFVNLCPACFLSSSRSIPMGNESVEYLPLVADSSTSTPGPELEDGFGHRKSKPTRYTFSPRERLLVLVILLQAIALITSVLTGSGAIAGTCRCPPSDRSILYCKSCSLGRDSLLTTRRSAR